MIAGTTEEAIEILAPILGAPTAWEIMEALASILETSTTMGVGVLAPTKTMEVERGSEEELEKASGLSPVAISEGVMMESTLDLRTSILEDPS